MALKIYDQLEQGSDEWLEARRGIVTASTVGQLITPSTVRPANNDKSRALRDTLIAERITGWVEPVYVSADMMRGQEDEPVARDLYREHYAPVEEVGFMRMDEPGFTLGFSPDGLVGSDGLIEIKSRKPRAQLQTILYDTVPPFNRAQLQAGLLVSGREWVDYVSYSSGMPFYVTRVHRDERWIDTIRTAVTDFETYAAETVARYEEVTVGMPTTTRIKELEIVI